MADTLKTLINNNASQPPEGIIRAITGSAVDIQLRGSPTLVRNVAFSGSPASLQIGQRVSLRWDHGKPTVIGGVAQQTGTTSSVRAKGTNIVNTEDGLEVPLGAIGTEHLSFVPSVDGHTHADVFQMAGWVLDEDGNIHNGTTFLRPNGSITLGENDTVLNLASDHEGFLMWYGTDPETAVFSVAKNGALVARSGEIGGWTVTEDRLTAGNVELNASGQLILGLDENKATLSGSDPLWRLWVGATDPNDAPFRVTQTGQVYLEDAVINTQLQSGNFSAGSSGWKIAHDGKAEFNDVTIRGALQSVVFNKSTTSVLASRFIVTDGGMLISDVGISDTFIEIDTDFCAIGDYVNLQPAVNRSEWMLITSAPTPLATGFRYSVQRDISGLGATVFYAGEVIYSKGTSVYPDGTWTLGDYYDMGSYDLSLMSSQLIDAGLGGFLTLEGSRAWGPYFGVARRFGPAYNQIADVLRIGRLTDFLGVTGNKYGFSVGDANRRMTYTEDGLEIVTASGNTRINDAGVLTSALGIAAATTPDYVDGVGQLYIDPSTKQLRIRYRSGASYKDTLIATLI